MNKNGGRKGLGDIINKFTRKTKGFLKKCESRFKKTLTKGRRFIDKHHQAITRWLVILEKVITIIAIIIKMYS